jgi:cell pole-organizing protein PopZ
MSGTGAPPGEPAAEPSMEDILASIRRILNDDTEPAPTEQGASTGSEPPGDDVYELEPSMIVEDPAEPLLVPPPVEPAVEAMRDDEPLLGATAAAAAGASMGALVRVLGQRQTPIYRGGPTLEDIVRDELRPLLKSWLDENLAPMVERAVRAEIERVTRGGL